MWLRVRLRPTFQIHLKADWLKSEPPPSHLWSQHSTGCRKHQRHHDVKLRTHTHTTSEVQTWSYHCERRRSTHRILKSEPPRKHTRMVELQTHSHTLRPTVWASTAFHSAFPFTVEKSALWPRAFPTFRKETARECHASAPRARRAMDRCPSFMWRAFLV